MNKTAKAFLLAHAATLFGMPAQAFWWDKYPSRFEALQAANQWLSNAGEFNYKYMDYYLSREEEKTIYDKCMKEWDGPYFLKKESCEYRIVESFERKKGRPEIKTLKSRRCVEDKPTSQYVCSEAQIKKGVSYVQDKNAPNIMPDWKIVRRFKW